MRLEKIFRANSNQERAGVATLSSDKTDLKSKIFRRGKKLYYIFTKGSTHQEDTIIGSIHQDII